jgi:hypothetical protein
MRISSEIADSAARRCPAQRPTPDMRYADTGANWQALGRKIVGDVILAA